MFISTYRQEARFALSGRWGKAILITLIASLFGAILVGSSFNINFEIDDKNLSALPERIQLILEGYLMIAGSIGLILGIVQFLLGGVVQLGYCKALLKMLSGQEPSVSDLFSEMYRFWDGFLLSLLRSLFIFLWTLLFIIPGIIAAYRYSMAGFIMAENPGMTAMEAIRSSKAMMKGHKMELFLLELSFIGWMLLSVLTLGIGNLWLFPYMNTAYAAFYRSNSYFSSF